MAQRLPHEDKTGQLAYGCCRTIILVPTTVDHNRLVCPYCTEPLTPPVIPSKYR